MTHIIGSDVGFSYRKEHCVIENANFTIERGKMTAILGKNGCGKSTIVKLITALLPLSHGYITIDNVSVDNKDGIKIARKHCGIVFQNPDNQFVSPIISDDISFGLSNHQIPEAEFSDRISDALRKVNLTGYEQRNISSLSGGQKQKAALAGILAINNDILIFDEASSMLDPVGKFELKQLTDNLRDQNKTIVLISQNISDVIDADKIILMANHKILATGTPREILTDYDLLNNAGVQIPFPVRVYHDLVRQGVNLSKCPLTDAELAEELCNLF